MKRIMEPTSAAREEARRHPGQHVYVIDGKYGLDEHVPPEVIVGA